MTEASHPQRSKNLAIVDSTSRLVYEEFSLILGEVNVKEYIEMFHLIPSVFVDDPSDMSSQLTGNNVF